MRARLGVANRLSTTPRGEILLSTISNGPTGELAGLLPVMCAPTKYIGGVSANCRKFCRRLRQR